MELKERKKNGKNIIKIGVKFNRLEIIPCT